MSKDDGLQGLRNLGFNTDTIGRKPGGGDAGYTLNDTRGSRFMLKHPRELESDEGSSLKEGSKDWNRGIAKVMLNEKTGSNLYAGISNNAFEVNQVNILKGNFPELEISGVPQRFPTGLAVSVKMFQNFQPFDKEDRNFQEEVIDGKPFIERPNSPYIDTASGKIFHQVTKSDGTKQAVEVEGYIEMCVAAKFLRDFDAIGFGGNAGIIYDEINGTARVAKVDTGKTFDSEEHERSRDFRKGIAFSPITDMANIRNTQGQQGKAPNPHNYNRTIVSLENKDLLRSLECYKTENGLAVPDTSICKDFTYDNIKKYPDVYDKYAKALANIASLSDEKLKEMSSKDIPKNFGGVDTKSFADENLKILVERRDKVKAFYSQEIAYAKLAERHTDKTPTELQSPAYDQELKDILAESKKTQAPARESSRQTLADIGSQKSLRGLLGFGSRTPSPKNSPGNSMEKLPERSSSPENLNSLTNSISVKLESQDQLQKIAKMSIPENAPVEKLAIAQDISARIAKDLAISDKGQKEILQKVVFASLADLKKDTVLSIDDKKSIAVNSLQNISKPNLKTNLEAASRSKTPSPNLSRTSSSSFENMETYFSQESVAPNKPKSLSDSKKESLTPEMEDALKQYRASQSSSKGSSEEGRQSDREARRTNRLSREDSAPKPLTPPQTSQTGGNNSPHVDFSSIRKGRPPVGDGKFTGNPNINKQGHDGGRGGPS